MSDALILFGGVTVSAGQPLSPYTWVLSAPPTVTANASRTVVDAGMADTFTAGVTEGFEPESVVWNFADGSSTTSGSVVTHSYTKRGLYSATASVTSFVGLSGIATAAVYVNPEPSVSASVGGSPTAGSPSPFLVSVTGGTAPFTYAWSFGDSSSTSTSTAAGPSHTYLLAGTYTATVKVTDALGVSANATVSVTVSAAPSTSASLTSGTGLGLLVGIIVLVVIVIALAVMLMRKPKNPVVMAPASPPVAPYSPPPPPPPA